MVDCGQHFRCESKFLVIQKVSVEKNADVKRLRKLEENAYMSLYTEGRVEEILHVNIR